MNCFSHQGVFLLYSSCAFGFFFCRLFQIHGLINKDGLKRNTKTRYTEGGKVCPQHKKEAAYNRTHRVQLGGRGSLWWPAEVGCPLIRVWSTYSDTTWDPCTMWSLREGQRYEHGRERGGSRQKERNIRNQPSKHKHSDDVYLLQDLFVPVESRLKYAPSANPYHNAWFNTSFYNQDLHIHTYWSLYITSHGFWI